MQILILLTAWVCIMAGCTTAKGRISSDPGPGGITMRWIEPGTFNMGSADTEPGRKKDEGPVTKVTITKGYYLSQTEVTIGQWKAVTGESLRDHVIKMLQDETVYDFGGQKKKLREFMNFNPNDPDRIMANENDSLPMYFVSWNDAMEFCRLLTLQEKAKKRVPDNFEYTLPTEAQWEYACRAGTDVVPVLDSIAWYSRNSGISYRGKKLGNPGAGPRNAGEKKPNAWGLQDMPGNIWEWCSDWYGPYSGGELTDPGGPATGTARVNRGGSWGSGPDDSRPANRAKNPQPEKSAWRGFRIALVSRN